MEKSKMAPRGMVVTPHHFATQTALDILREGGTAIEAIVAAAATIAVVYPHMNSIGGDGFWLIVPPQGDPIVIEACGPAGSLATDDFFAGLDKIPYTGPKSANTVAGTIGGWIEALEYVGECGYPRMSVSRLLADAIWYAEKGFPVSADLEDDFKKIRNHESFAEEFRRIFLPENALLERNDNFRQENLANTLKYLANYGLDSFYRGELASLIADDMATLGMPITKLDLENYYATRRIPLRLKHSHGVIYNTPPPTQGAVSLAILGILDKLQIDGRNEGEFIHVTVEATKQAWTLRDQYITDPAYMKIDPQSLINSAEITNLAHNINFDEASSTSEGKGYGDTVWLGVMDRYGFSVSFIQSVYHSFGSGIVLPNTGILWHNRGTAFSLNKDHLLYIKPGKKPYHTLNPAAAKLNDGRLIVYGTMGGDGQPQTQAAIFHRYVVQGLPLQKSVSSPRWVFGRLLGDFDDKLKLENRFSNKTIEYLEDRGHEVNLLEAFSSGAGHAGMLVRHPSGMMEGAYDPRSDGSAAGF